MTEREAREILKYIKDNLNDSRRFARHDEAIDVAIQALDQTELNPSYNRIKTELDCISRTDALNAFKPKGISEELWMESNTYKVLTKLLSVTPKAEWIPCSERLPDTDDKVLCWYEYYHWSRGKVLPEYGIGCYLRETSAWFGEVANGKDVKVIAWMPLPEPFREEDRDEN